MITKLSSLAKNRATYRVGLLQAKAYRVLKQKTAEILKPYGVTTFEWAFLGLLSDRGAVRPKLAAEELGVEAPFVTQMVRGLKKKGFILEERETKDTRAKSISLTPSGTKFVQSVEPVVRAHIRPLLKDVGVSEVLGYLAVLEKIVANQNRRT